MLHFPLFFAAAAISLGAITAFAAATVTCHYDTAPQI
jgi:hypothetical protein